MSSTLHLHRLSGLALTLAIGLPGLPVRAEVPPEEAPALYAQTLADHRNLSPLWGMVALRSGVLANIRFSGGYGPALSPDFPPMNPASAENDFPQDGVSGVVQFLFPSPDGWNLVHNERAKDPIGLIAQEVRDQRTEPGHTGGLHRILALLEAVTHYRQQLHHAPEAKSPEEGPDRDFEAAAVRILSKPSAGAKGKVEPGESGFDRLRRQFAGHLRRAVQEESAPGRGKYPPDIVEAALLAFAWKVADSGAEFHAAWDGHLLVPPAPGARPAGLGGPLGLDPFEGLMKHEAGSSGAFGAEDLVPALLAFQEGHTRIPPLVDYQMAAFGAVSFPDCGETSLRNFFNIVFNLRGLLPGSVVDAFLAKCAPPSDRPSPVEAFRAFYRNHGTQILQLSSSAHDDWSRVVSGLNRGPDDPLPIVYRNGTCNLAGVGLVNMLNLVAHLLPDPLLNQAWPEDPAGTLALAARKLTRLCDLASREDSTLAWSVDGVQETLRRSFCGSTMEPMAGASVPMGSPSSLNWP